MNDKQLVEEILQNNSNSAFEFLIKKYQGLVLNVCYRIIHNIPDAEDTAQEVFLEAYRSLAFLKNADDIAGWLFKISYNKSISFLRKKNPAKASSAGEFDTSSRMPVEPGQYIIQETPHITLEKKEAYEVLFRAIDRLPDRQKQALLLHKFEGYSHKETGDIMQLSQASVESLIYRAKISLRKTLSSFFKNS